MPITVTCSSCNKKYQFRETSAGKSVVCKECGAKMRVPALNAGRGSKSDDDEYAIPDDDSDEEFAPIAPRPSRSGSSARKTPGRRSSSSGIPAVVWIVCGAGGAVFLIVAVILFFAFGRGGAAPDIAQNGGNPANPAVPGAQPTPGTGAADSSGVVASTSSRAWKVTTDPLPQLPQFDPKTPVNVSIPNKSNGDVVYPDSPSPFVAVGSNNSDTEIREVRDLRNDSRVGSIRPAQIFSAKTALSPDGLYFAAWTYSKNQVELWDVKGEQSLGQVPADGTSPRLLMFAGNKRLIAAGNKDEFQVWSIPERKSERTVPLPKVIGDPLAGLSPGGKFMAVGFDEMKNHSVRVFNLESGDIAGEITLTGLDDGNPRCHGIAFSPDGQDLAVLYDSFKESRIVAFNVADGKLTAHAKMGGSLKQTLKAYGSGPKNPLEWFPSKKRWFVYGIGVVDRAAGKVIWTMPDEKPGKEPIRRVLDDEHILTIAGDRRKDAAVVAFDLPGADLERSADVVKSGGLPIDAQLPKLTAANWSGATEVSLDGAARGWTVQLDPASAGADKLLPAPMVLASTSATVKSAALSSPAAGRAVVLNSIHNATPRRSTPAAKLAAKVKKKAADPDSPAWLSVIDLAASNETGTVEIPFDCSLESVSPDGKRALVRLSEGESRLDVWSLDDEQHIVGWRPYLKEKDNDQIIRQAAFVDSDHVATTNASGNFAVWELPACRAVYTVDKAHHGYFSQNRKIVAIPAGGKAIRFFDALTGQSRGDLQSAGRVAAAAFHSGGERFAATFADGLGHRLVCWNVKEGKIETEFALPDSGVSMHFCGDNYVLLDTKLILDAKTQVDARLLIDLERQMIVWKYNPASGLHVADSPDGRHWFLAMPSARSTSVSLVAATLPEPAAQAKLANAKFEPDMVIKPGSQVTLQTTLSATPPGKPGFAQDLTKMFTDTLTRNKISVTDGQSVVMKVTMNNIKTGKMMELQLSQFGGATVVNQKVSIPENLVECSVQVLRGGNVVWERKQSFANGALFFQVPQGKTAEQHLNDMMWESAGNFLLHFQPPAYVFADSAFNGLGSSPLTAETASAAR